MPKASVTRHIARDKQTLIDFVLDIEKYPEFIPFCIDSKVYETNDNGNEIEIIAGKNKGFHNCSLAYHKLELQGKYHKSNQQIDWKTIKNRWKIHPEAFPNACLKIGRKIAQKISEKCEF